MKANDSVLITARAPGPSLQPSQTTEAAGGRGLRRQTGGEGEATLCGGSGFVRQGVVLTSATWLANLLTLRHRNSHSMDSSPGSIPTAIEWELTEPNTSFHILYQTTPDRICTTVGPSVTKTLSHNQWSSSGLSVRKADIDSIMLLRDVYMCLESQLQTMGHWRCDLQTLPVQGARKGGGVGGGEEKGRGELVSLESLLLPLSCVVVLKVEGLEPSCIGGDDRPGYRPCVGDKLVSISTPFATYCPEVFHDTMTTGHVCKLIGRNGSVFLTDACHLPNTEGAGLRRDRSLSVDVVAMVLAPLFCERGHPTGLSLATSLSSLPPPSPLPPPSTLLPLPQDNLTGVSKLVVGVAVGSNWGSGILLSRDRILTCAHVVTKLRSSPVTIYIPSESRVHSGSVLEWNGDMDLAVIGLRDGIVVLEPVWDQIHRSHSQSVGERRPQEYRGGPVCAIGYECPPWQSSAPLVTRGVVTQVAGWGGKGVMVVSSAVVLPGMSGGLLVSEEDGCLLGMIVSISEHSIMTSQHNQEIGPTSDQAGSGDTTTGHTYSTVNYSLSLPWLLPALLPYILKGEGEDLHQLMSENGERVKLLWTLGGGGLISKL